MTAFIPKDVLSETYKGTKLIKDMLDELCANSIKEEGENYNFYLRQCVADAIRLSQSIEAAQNLQFQLYNQIKLNGGKIYGIVKG